MVEWGVASPAHSLFWEIQDMEKSSYFSLNSSTSHTINVLILTLTLKNFIKEKEKN